MPRMWIVPAPFLPALALVLCLAAGGGATASVLLRPASSSSLSRLDPTLRRLAENPELPGPSNARIRANSEGERSVSVLLATRPGSDLAALEAIGVRLHGAGETLGGARSAGDPRRAASPSLVPLSRRRPEILTAEAPLASLRLLAAWPDLLYAETARESRLLLDRSVPEIRANAARSVFRRDGSKVLIGLVDSGIDIRHPDFLGPDGRTRIRALWDQTDLDGPHPEGFQYGREYSGEEIDHALTENDDIGQRDDDTRIGGHGTHVAGIAAGAGTGSPYAGVAPGADLIVVKWDGVNGLDANRYLMARAGAMKRPIVVNNSWGGHNGPHDGSDLETTGLSALAGSDRPGRILCFAVGNNGDEPIHAGGALAPGEVGEVALVAPAGQKEFEIEVWADAASEFRFGLRYPRDSAGKTRASFSVMTGKSGTHVVPSLVEAPYADADVSIDARDAPYPPNPALQRSTIYVNLEETPLRGTLLGLYWVLTIHRLNDAGTGAFDAWLTLDSPITFDTTGNSLKGDTTRTIVNQACAANGIAVGAYISKTEWIAFNNIPVSEYAFGRNPGDPSLFSSEGPTRDGRRKPELSAPGQWVASSLSGDLSLPSSARRYITPDGGHLLLEGTSMASPHVAGTLALMLEASPEMTSETALEYLMSGLRTSFEWSPKEGYGKLNSFESLRILTIKKPQLPGDLNGDGRIDVADVYRALQFALNIYVPLPEEIAIGDVAPRASDAHPEAGDGLVTVSDVIVLLRRTLHLEPNPWSS